MYIYNKKTNLTIYTYYFIIKTAKKGQETFPYYYIILNAQDIKNV